jgi:putrescine aminotransferase
VTHSALKARYIEKAREFVIPGRVRSFEGMEVMPVLASAGGYRFKDMDGQEFQDFHLNGGTFNLGHRNPELCRVLEAGLQTIGIGNHHFVSRSRSELAEKLAASVPGLRYTVFTASGSEANDVAIKSARRATGRRRIVSIAVGYHGRSGLSGAAGDADNARYFLSDMDSEFATVPFDDLNALEAALSGEHAAAFLIETIPATYGFLRPHENYYAAARQLCDRYGTLLIVDEVQTGLGRTGKLWGIESLDIRPDILVTGKGLSGGIYPIAAVLLSPRSGAWLEENGWGHVSTFGGADLGCQVALRVLEICSEPDNLKHAIKIAAYLRHGLLDIQRRKGYLKSIHGIGLAMGLEFDSPSGGVDMMKALYDRGLWAMFASFNSAILQFKPGFLIDLEYCDEALQRVDDAIDLAKIKPPGKSVKLAGGADVADTQLQGKARP